MGHPHPRHAERDVDFNILAKLGFKLPSHHPLISESCIRQSKEHHFVMVIPNGRNKSSLFLII